MDLLDYSLAAFNPPSDSLAAAYPDLFTDRSTGHELYDDDDDDDVDDDVTDDVTADFKQSQLIMQDINAQSVTCVVYHSVYVFVVKLEKYCLPCA